jgi:hypothetical protein
MNFQQHQSGVSAGDNRTVVGHGEGGMQHGAGRRARDARVQIDQAVGFVQKKWSQWAFGIFLIAVLAGIFAAIAFPSHQIYDQNAQQSKL